MLRRCFVYRWSIWICLEFSEKCFLLCFQFCWIFFVPEQMLWKCIDKYLLLLWLRHARNLLKQHKDLALGDYNNNNFPFSQTWYSSLIFLFVILLIYFLIISGYRRKVFAELSGCVVSLLEAKVETSRVPGIGKELMSSQFWQLDICQWYILPAVFLGASCWSAWAPQGFSNLNTVLCLLLRFTVKNQPLLLGWDLAVYFLLVFQPLVTVHYQLSYSSPVIFGMLFEALSSNSTHYLGTYLTFWEEHSFF